LLPHWQLLAEQLHVWVQAQVVEPQALLTGMVVVVCILDTEVVGAGDGVRLGWIVK